jgi:hypothetical protein
LPTELVAAVKRDPSYRRIRCHLAAACPSDGWLDPDDHIAFVTFEFHPFEGVPAQVGFAVDLRTRTVTNARLLLSMPEGLWSRSLESVPICGPMIENERASAALEMNRS